MDCQICVFNLLETWDGTTRVMIIIQYIGGGVATPVILYLYFRHGPHTVIRIVVIQVSFIIFNKVHLDVT